MCIIDKMKIILIDKRFTIKVVLNNLCFKDLLISRKIIIQSSIKSCMISEGNVINEISDEKQNSLFDKNNKTVIIWHNVIL